MTGSAHLQAEPRVEVAGTEDLPALLGLGFWRSAVPMVCLDEAMVITCANPAALLLLSADSLDGRSFSELCTEPPALPQWWKVQQTAAGNNKQLRIELPFVTDSGDVIKTVSLLERLATGRDEYLLLLQVLDTGAHVGISDDAAGAAAATDFGRLAAQRSALLRQIGDMLSSTNGGTEELLQGIVNFAALALDCAAVLCILAPDGRKTEQVLVAHPDNKVRELTDAMRRSTQCSEPGPLRRQVIEQGLILSSLSTAPAVPEHHRRLGEQTGWWVEHSVCTPIRHNGEVFGVFSVFRSDPAAEFEPGDENLVQILADRIGGLHVESRSRLATEREREERLRQLVDQQKQLLDELAGMESRERSLLAESIHDEPIQLIVASIMRIDRLGLRSEPAEREELDKIASQLEVTVDWLRNLIVVALTPPELSDGLGIALADLADGIFLGSTRFTLEGPHDVLLSEGAKAAAFRILREALVNTRKHAMAQNVTLRMSEHDGIVDISLTDDGVGTERIESTSGHLGMATMRARADAEGGRLRVDSAPGLGTTVTLTLPAAPGGRP